MTFYLFYTFCIIINSGDWFNGVRDGEGSCFFSNGESFEGMWESGHIALRGRGKLTLADGTVHIYD